MVQFSALIKKFGQQGEKTGWTYIEIPEAQAQQLIPGNKKGFRVKGFLDTYAIEQISLLPVGGGDFIMPLNTAMRKGIGKAKGAIVNVRLDVDTKPVELSKELMECLADEPAALAYFSKLPGSHQKYYSKWIESARTEPTKAKRIAATVNACARNLGYGEMLRALKEERKKLEK